MYSKITIGKISPNEQTRTKPIYICKNSTLYIQTHMNTSWYETHWLAHAPVDFASKCQEKEHITYPYQWTVYQLIILTEHTERGEVHRRKKQPTQYFVMKTHHRKYPKTIIKQTYKKNLSFESTVSLISASNWKEMRKVEADSASEDNAAIDS